MQDEKQILENLPLEINNQDGKRIEIFDGLADTYNGKHKLPGFHHIHSQGGFGEMAFHHYAGEGFDIWYSNYAITHNSKFHARGNFPALELHIPFNSHFISWWDGHKETQVRDNQFEMSYFPFIDSRSEFAGGHGYSTFDIHYSTTYLKKFSPHYSILSQFLGKVEKNEPANLLGTTQFLSPAMISLVNGMLMYDMSDAMAPYFYESSVLQMLIRVLDRLSCIHTEADIHYTQYDIERATEARDIILSDLSVKYSIAELARRTAINEGKLQHCFKQLFGTTIFDYSQSARLDLAKFLLSTTKDSIQSIAERSGYPDHPNLTAAFRKKFGCTPEYYRANKK